MGTKAGNFGTLWNFSILLLCNALCCPQTRCRLCTPTRRRPRPLKPSCTYQVGHPSVSHCRVFLFSFAETGDDVNAACLCGQRGQPPCRCKPKQTLRHCDLISTSEELYALTPASHYTSKKELGRKTNACVKMHSWKWEGWKSVNSKYHGAENNPKEPFVSYFLLFACETSILTTWVMECSSSKDFYLYIMLAKVQTNNSTLLAQPHFLHYKF